MHPDPSQSSLHTLLTQAWAENVLVKVVLSAPRPANDAPPALLRLKARPVQLRSGWKLAVTECLPRSEMVRNHAPSEGFARLAQEFSTRWNEAHVFTLGADYQIRRDARGREQVRKTRSAFSQMPDSAHDKSKAVRGDLSREGFLQRLGVTQPDGKPRPGMAGKLRQISRFVELLGHLLEASPWGREAPGEPLQIADMGAGKGYLTFAIAWMLRARGWPAEIVGIELRRELVEASNALARSLGWEELRFEQGAIENWTPAGGLDVLVALHACDTATDDALHQGIRHGATLLVTSPCCHKQVRPQLRAPAELAPALGHGILEERFAEILTDGIRALALERAGYEARVFEFVEPEHSGKNLMLAALRKPGSSARSVSAGGALETLMRTHGIENQRLVQLLEGRVP